MQKNFSRSTRHVDALSQLLRNMRNNTFDVFVNTYMNVRSRDLMHILDPLSSGISLSEKRYFIQVRTHHLS